ncbi:MAG: hypothetical protein GWO39_00940 [Gammaproteobacteria bacterium]|nr:hypothetical protein [Gammaproteobacteria bacterium]NIT62405.1 hypothetical protein [Gammaproteobacteria bacterium]NIV19337.1 hypothetical protein [Gammaproteobacteria bacterium]NIY30985.1 hypothetical protein [Gammaproteobacteria bacterium]
MLEPYPVRFFACFLRLAGTIVALGRLLGIFPLAPMLLVLQLRLVGASP